MEQRRKYAEELVIEAKKGIIRGLPVYGDFDPDTDERNMLHEKQEEILDIWNYNEFDSMKFPEREVYHNRVKTLALSLYILMREEEEHRTLTNRG